MLFGPIFFWYDQANLFWHEKHRSVIGKKTFIQYSRTEKAQDIRHICLYSIGNITSAGSSPQFLKYLLSKFILQQGSVRHQKGHNPLAYMMCIYSLLSLQCIIGRFSDVAFFSFFLWVEEDFCCRVLVYISRDKSKTGSDELLFFV